MSSKQPKKPKPLTKAAEQRVLNAARTYRDSEMQRLLRARDDFHKLDAAINALDAAEQTERATAEDSNAAPARRTWHAGRRLQRFVLSAARLARPSRFASHRDLLAVCV